MMRIALIGTGNLATHLATAFETCNAVQFVQWIGRLPTSPIKALRVPYFTHYQNDIATDICIVSVSDDAIPHVAEQLKNVNALVAHTAGAESMDALKPINRRGVFYPLQTFKKNFPVDWSTTPICVEATNPSNVKLLKNVAMQLSKHVHQITEHQRLQLHAAAVFSNNFCNHLLGVSQQITEKAVLPFSLLQPLIRKTFEQSFSNQATNLQTGPAKRNDQRTMKKHLTVLADSEAELYRILSQSIFNTYNHEL